MTKVLPSGVILPVLGKGLKKGLDISVGVQVGQQHHVVLENVLSHRMLHSERHLANHDCRLQERFGLRVAALVSIEHPQIVQTGGRVRIGNSHLRFLNGKR
jgi:hypothetical protein